jgi:hypothetical protein
MPPNNAKRKRTLAKDVPDTWPSPSPYNTTNTDPSHKLNLKDRGFNHLGIPTPILSTCDLPVIPTAPALLSPTTEESYITQIAQKPSLAQRFIHAELDLALNLNRRMDKDATTQLLCTPPISLTLYTQEVLRNLIKLRIEMLDLGKDESANEGKLQVLGHEFLWAWNELRGVLEGLMPGGDVEMRREMAERVLVGVLGESLVEGVAEEGEGHGHGHEEKGL